MNFSQLHLPRPERSLPDDFFSLLSSLWRGILSPYCNEPSKSSCWLKDVMGSNFWIMKWPRNLCGVLTSSCREVKFLLVSSSHIWLNFIYVMRWARSKFFSPLNFSRYCMLIKPTGISLLLKLVRRWSPNCVISYLESSFLECYMIWFY